MSEHFNKISGYFNHIANRHDIGAVFNDFLTLSICAYHTTNLKSRFKEKDPKNEALYFEALNKYNKEEINIFPKLLAELHLLLNKHPYTDPLGEYYMMNITNGKNGQYFTPDAICGLMARLQGTEIITDKIISDPACGSGRMFLAFAQIHPQNVFVGNDNNNTCAKMAVLNLFLHNLTAEINWMDTLKDEWYGGWHINTEQPGIRPMEPNQKDSPEEPVAEDKQPVEKISGLKPLPPDQLNLFNV